MAETTTLYFRDAATNSDKFYEATVDGGTVTFRWGRRGTSGQRQVFQGDNYSAQNEYHKRIAEKRAKGYRPLPSESRSRFGEVPTATPLNGSVREQTMPTMRACFICGSRNWCPHRQPPVRTTPEPEPAGWPRGIRHIKPNTD